MSKNRASIFEGEDDLDLSGFAPKTKPDTAAPAPEEVRAVSEAANFRSREPEKPKSAPQKREPRRYRTGRNQQFNIKAKSETIAEFYAITDQQQWVLGETLDKALAALRRELDTGQK
jgi:hypothetical protein